MGCCLFGVPSHYLNQYWLLVNWTMRKKFQWKYNQTTGIFIQQNAFQSVFCKLSAIWIQPKCVKHWSILPISSGVTTMKLGKHAASPRSWSPLAGRAEGIVTEGFALHFRQKITINLIVSKAVLSRGPHGSGQFCVMHLPQCQCSNPEWYG